MANNLTSNTSSIVLKKFLPGFMSDLVSCKTVNRQLIGDGDLDPSTGDTIAVKRPTQFKSSRSATGDMSGLSSDVVSGKASAVVQDYITVRVASTDVEQALQSDQWDELLKPVRSRIVTDLETSLNDFMLRNGAHQIGTPGAQLATWKDVAQVNAFMESLGIPNDNGRYAQINPYAQMNLADAQSSLASGDAGLVNEAWQQATIRRNFGGLQAYTSNALSNITAGNQVGNAGITLSGTPTQTYLSTKDTFTTVLALTGLTATTGTIAVGDVIRVTAASGASLVNNQTKKTFRDQTGAVVKWTATVVAGGTASGAGALSITVTGPAIYESTGAYNNISAALISGDAVAVITAATASATVQPNMFYHKDAFGLSTVKLKKLAGWDSSVVNYEGFSIRLTQFSDAITNVHGWRFDLRPAFTAFNPMMAGRFYGV